MMGMAHSGWCDPGMPEAAARLYASFGTATRRGCQHAVEDLTGNAPRPAREVVLSLVRS
jgi:hypothetical protein